MTVTIALIPQALFTVWLWLWALLPLKNRINVPSPGNWVSLYCGSNAILWFHRLGHKRQYSFCLVLLGHSLLKPKMLHGQSNEASVNSQSKLPNEWASLGISPAFTSSQLRSKMMLCLSCFSCHTVTKCSSQSICCAKFLWFGLYMSSDGKESTYNAGDPDLIPGLGRSPGGRNGNPL